MENLEELKKKYEELGKEIERLEKKKTGRWRAEHGKRYYYISAWGDIDASADQNNNFADWHYKTRNYFKTTEEAQEHLEKINTYYELMDLAEELNGGEEIDWNNGDQRKFNIYCAEEAVLFDDFRTINKEIGQIYCLNENFLEIAKERIGEERLLKLFK